MNDRTAGRVAAAAAAGALLLFASRLLALHLAGPALDQSELVTGSLANALIEGPLLPAWALRAAEPGLGTPALAAVAAFWFLVFGKTALSLKAAALTLAALSAALLALLAGRIAGWGAALLVGLFCVLLPPGAFDVAAFARGPALPGLLLGLAALYSALLCLEDNAAHPGRGLAWGLCSGLAYSVDSALLAPLLIPLGLALARDLNFLARAKVLPIALGAALGAVPGLIWTKPASLPALFEPEARTLALAAQPDLLWLLLGVLVLLGLVGLYERDRRIAAGPRAEVAALALWLVALALSIAGRDARLLDALALALVLPAALLCRRMLGSSPLLGLLVVLALLLPGMAGALQSYRPGPADRSPLSGRGYERGAYLVEAGSAWSADVARLATLAERIDPRDRALLAFGAGAAYGGSGDTLRNAVQRCTDLPEFDRSACAVGAGYGNARTLESFVPLRSGSMPDQLTELGALLAENERGLWPADQVQQAADELTAAFDPQVGAALRALVRSRLDLGRLAPVQ